MEQQRRTFLKGAGATVFAFTPGIRGIETQENEVVCNEDGTCREKISRNADEPPLSLSEIEDAQRRVVRAYRRKFGSNDPISVGRVGPLLEFPLYSFAYTIDAQGRSSFMIGGPKDLDRPRGEPTTAVAEETATPAEEAEETATEPVGRGADVASRIASVQRVTDELQVTAERSIPAAAEIDLSDIDRVAETTTAEGETTESAASPPMAMGTGTSQQDVTVENLVSVGIAVVETEAGRIISRARLGLDRTLPERRAHLVVQDLNVQPNRDQDWRIQSTEAVHDWRSGYSPVITVVQHEPDGLSGGPDTAVGVSIGLSGPSASWSYSQPDVTRLNLSEARKAKWRWRWNRSDAGRSSEAFKIGSLTTAIDGADRGDHLGVVRSGVTFRRRGGLFGRETGKVRVAQVFGYE